jgi:nicotinamidase/pyrazinamidase
VKLTALDARRLGFQTFLIEDGCRGVELRPGDTARAVAEMRSAGVEVVVSAG